MHVLPTFSDLLNDLKEGNESNGHYIKGCENAIEHPHTNAYI
jgi:hypothetical protein